MRGAASSLDAGGAAFASVSKADSGIVRTVITILEEWLAGRLRATKPVGGSIGGSFAA